MSDSTTKLIRAEYERKIANVKRHRNALIRKQKVLIEQQGQEIVRLNRERSELMLKIEAKKNPETDRYYGEVTWAGWQVFLCPNEYDHKQDALDEANRQFAGRLRWVTGS